MARKKSVPTILDVAAAAGVSVTTVSRVLNNKDDVAPETAARIRSVIDGLGYASNPAARSMRSARTHTIGLVARNLENSFMLLVLRGVSRLIAERPYDLIVFTGGHRDEPEHAPWERHQVARFNGSITDGVLVVTPYSDWFRTEYPLVAIDPHAAETTFPSVIATNHVGAMSAVRHLVELGHRRIALLGGRSELQSAQRRLQGYVEALQEAGIAPRDDYIMVGDFMQETARRCARHLLQLADRPTAVFAANDESAIGVVDAARELGLRVPEDLSVIGFDNVPEAALFDPPLTTVDQAVEQMGMVATQMLLDLIEGRPLASPVQKVATRLIVRRSTQPPASPTRS